MFKDVDRKELVLAIIFWLVSNLASVYIETLAGVEAGKLFIFCLFWSSIVFLGWIYWAKSQNRVRCALVFVLFSLVFWSPLGFSYYQKNKKERAANQLENNAYPYIEADVKNGFVQFTIFNNSPMPLKERDGEIVDLAAEQRLKDILKIPPGKELGTEDKRKVILGIDKFDMGGDRSYELVPRADQKDLGAFWMDKDPNGKTFKADLTSPSPKSRFQQIIRLVPKGTAWEQRGYLKRTRDGEVLRHWPPLGAL